MLFGTAEVLIAARDLVDGRAVRSVPGGEVDYFHLLFDCHQIVFAEGMATESFLPGPQLKHSFEASMVRDIRRLLIIGASAVVSWAARKGPPDGSWLARMMARKPRMLVVVALANKMARIIWAMSVRKENYRTPSVAV